MSDPAAVLSNLIFPALRIAGITDRPNRVPSLDQSGECIGIANRMMGSWNCDRLKIYSNAIDTYQLVPGQGTYFIGPTGADFVAPRPINIVRANVILANTSPGIHYPLRLLEVVDWAALRIPQLPGGAWSSRLYWDRAVPNSQLMLFPVPGESDQLELFTATALQQFVALTDTVVLPDGYEEAIVFNLAVKIAAQFPSQARMSEAVPAIAAESLARIEGRNAPVPKLKNDAAHLGHGHRGASRWWLMGSELD